MITTISIGNISATPIRGGRCGRRARASHGQAATAASAPPGPGASKGRGSDVVEGSAGPDDELNPAEDRRDGTSEHQDPHLAPLGLHRAGNEKRWFWERILKKLRMGVQDWSQRRRAG